MAKIKESTRKLRSDTAKTTTHGKAMNKSVNKVRINIKTIKSRDDTSKKGDIKCEDKTVLEKTRSCLIKLQRITPDIQYSFNNTLLAQCKVDKNENNKSDAKTMNQNNSEKKANYVQNMVNTTKEEVRKAYQNFENCNKNVLEQPKINTKTVTKMLASESILDKSSVLKSNEKNSSVKSPRRHCNVRLKRTCLNQSYKQMELSDTKNTQINIKNKVESQKSSNLAQVTTRGCTRTMALQKSKSAVVKPSTPKTKQRSVVRLQKTPITIKTKDMIKPLTTSITKKCVVKLQRNLVSRRKKVNKEHLDSTLTTMPVIDQNKRDNMRKLSLTKSSGKSLHNKENKTDSNLKLECHNKKYEQQPEIAMSYNDNISKANQLVNTIKTQGSVNNQFKLSLRRQIKLNTNLEDFNQHQTSTTHFDPVRNSTLLELDVNKDNSTEILTEKPKETTPSKDKSLSQNFTNKSEEIENLLNSLDDEDEMSLKSPYKTIEKDVIIQSLPQENDQEQTNISSHQTNKFFHRRKANIEENIIKAPAKSKSKFLPKNQQRARKSRLLSKRSTMKMPDKIYDFLSQSQTSDSDCLTKHADPAADIIKKLIAQGKVRVATNCKGKGKPKFKRKLPSKPPKKIKHAIEKKLKQLKNNTNKTAGKRNLKNNLEDNYSDELEDERFTDDYFEPSPDIDYLANPEIAVPQQQIHHKYNKKKGNDQEGTFSRLAKTVLMKQTGQSDLQRKNASLLLELVKKYVSTPKNKKIPATEADLVADISPIAMPPPRPPPKASPWRVDEDYHLPKTFNFSISSGNLPSFSSDFIPSTPRRKKKHNINVEQQKALSCRQSPIKENQNVVTSIPTFPSPQQVDAENIQPPSLNVSSVISSFSSNDSNAENMPPPRTTNQNSDENDNIFNMRHLPNPRRTLNHRSPLKTINILEVVHLPPYKKTYQTHDSKKNSTNESIDMFGFEENLAEKLSQEDQNISINLVSHQQVIADNTKTHHKEDLFGFEDFLSQTEFSSQEQQQNANNDDLTTNTLHQTIHDKLQDLRKLKPDDEELQISLLKKKVLNPPKVTHLFDDGTASVDGMRQRGIKEMLCSTMINQQPSTSKESLRQLKSRNLQDAKKPNFEELSACELFKDTEVETTFNENEAHRTYIRPYKRKKRLKQKKYVIFLDSDESDDEENSAEQKKLQNSHETETSSERSPKKKRQRKEPKEKPELAEFVKEFNEMCKEVDSYKLIVEKST